MCCSIPSLLPTIQERLLDSISFVLLKAPYLPSRISSTGSIRAGAVVNAPQSSSDVNNAVVVQLALHTLAHFNFKVISFPKLTVQGLYSCL
jgi:serine/threonine-protein kinase mTOR